MTPGVGSVATLFPKPTFPFAIIARKPEVAGLPVSVLRILPLIGIRSQPLYRKSSEIVYWIVLFQD
jgi:hypothetical protein